MKVKPALDDHEQPSGSAEPLLDCAICGSDDRAHASAAATRLRAPHKSGASYTSTGR